MGLFASSCRAYRSNKIFQTQKSKMSSDIAWAITKNNSAYLLKKRNCPKPFSTDPMNLTNKHCKRFVGLVNKKALAIAPASDNKGFTVTIKKGSSNRPGKNKDTVTMKAGPRRSLHKVKALIVKQRYRKDLTKAAMQRAAVLFDPKNLCLLAKGLRQQQQRSLTKLLR